MHSIARTGQIRTRAKGLSGSRPLVMLVEDSRTFTYVLAHRFREEAGVDVVVCDSLKAFKGAVASAGSLLTLAVVDLNLVDSPNREVLDFALDAGVPTIVFTGAFDFNTRANLLQKNVLDYVIKDNELAFDSVVNSLRRILDNRNIRVLVADNHAGPDKSAVVEMLQAQQFLVAHTSSAKETLEALRHYTDVELALVDFDIDGGDGVDLVRQIRREHPSDQLRIIGLSSISEPLVSAAFLKAGATDFLYTPFLQEEFQCRVAQNIETLAQIKKLRAIAAKDFLTDMYNRRYFFERGPVLVKHCLERGDPCCAVVMDIDHFKKFNDVHGHDTGDLVLKTVARKLREMVDEDFHLPARLGGEEFAVLLRNMAVKEATEYCDLIREEIGRTVILHKEEELSVKVSMGVAEIFAEETFDNYLNAADQYLYMAKNSGRNRVFSDYSITQLFSARREAAG